MKNYIAPKTETLNINVQTILAPSGEGGSTPTGGSSTGFSGDGQTVGQGGMEAKQTTTTFTFD